MIQSRFFLTLFSAMACVTLCEQSVTANVCSIQKLKVFILAGQSNMQGHGVVDLDDPRDYNGGKGTLIWSMKHSASKDQMRHLRDQNGVWVTRDDVVVRYQTEGTLKRSGLTIGLSGYEGKHHIGLELQFGHIVGDYFDEPVLLIKTAWGGKSLYKDFRPPSAEGDTGEYYTLMIKEVHEALAAIDTDFPQLRAGGVESYEIAGFVWMQGWNDMIDEEARKEYADNLVHLASDVRKEFKTPELPFIVGELGNGGEAKSGTPMQQFRDAQQSGTQRISNAKLVVTHTFARPAEMSPNVGHGHHWYGNAESYFLIGDALGRAMIELNSK